MDSILKKMELRGNISLRLTQSTDCADEILITARTTQAMIDTFVKFKIESLKYGLIVNVHKIFKMFQETRLVKTHKY
jgi:hypothetical protein